MQYLIYLPQYNRIFIATGHKIPFGKFKMATLKDDKGKKYTKANIVVFSVGEL